MLQGSKSRLIRRGLVMVVCLVGVVATERSINVREKTPRQPLCGLMGKTLEENPSVLAAFKDITDLINIAQLKCPRVNVREKTPRQSRC